MTHMTTASGAIDTTESLHLLTTKCFRPAARPNLVPRPQLTARLDAAIEQGQKLILISAPAGFGKTTILTDWLAGPNAPMVAWFTLDDRDNHLGQFLSYLIATLEMVRPGIGAEAWQLLRAQVAYPPTHAILTILLNAVAISPARTILILDDYHIIALQAIHEAVAFLLDRMPAHMHVILTTRADPPLPLARLRARGQLTELRAADLRFSAAETGNLFGQIEDLALTPAAMRTLESRTEGWITGLQLAALVLRQNAANIPGFLADFTGSHHYVFDYLADEVFQQQPAAIQQFLMQTAILPRVCGSLSDALTGNSDGQAMLEHLDESNLFLIRLDSNRRWYRYHHLFADFLRERLERTSGLASRSILHRRASAWFEQQGLICEATDHAIDAQDWAAALRCITPIMTSEQLYGYYLDWPRWLTALPDTALLAVPEVCLRLGWILTLTGHVEDAERPLALAETTWQSQNNQPMIGAVLICRALLRGYQGNTIAAGKLAEEALTKITTDAEQRAFGHWLLANRQITLGHTDGALELLAEAQQIFRHGREALFGQACGMLIARTHHLQGRLQQSMSLYTELIRTAAGAIHLEQPASYLFLGLIHYEWDNLPLAEQLLHEGIRVGERTGRGRYWPYLYTALAQIHLAHGQTAQASELIEQTLSLSAVLHNTLDSTRAEALQVWLRFTQGRIAAIQPWIIQTLQASEPLGYEQQPTILTLARIQIAQERQLPGTGAIARVLPLLEQLLHLAEIDLRQADQIMILVCMALAYAVNQQQQQALSTLGRAVELAAPERYIRTFVDHGLPLHTLLATYKLQLSQATTPLAQSADALLGYLTQLLAAFPDLRAQEPAPAAPPSLLSEREQAVLQLIASGQSVQDIALQLIISTHTARSHIKNIYVKLDAHTRIQAIERARALHLLP